MPHRPCHLRDFPAPQPQSDIPLPPAPPPLYVYHASPHAVPASPPRKTYPLVSAKPLFPPLPDYPPSVHLILDYVDRDLEAKLIQLGKEITHFNNQSGRYERQYGLLFVHDPREVWPLVDMHNSLPVLILRLVEDIQEVLEQQVTQTIINGYLRGRGIRPHNDLHLFGRSVRSLSLGFPTVMRFKEAKLRDRPELQLPVPGRSLLVLRDEMRYDWNHGILDGDVQGDVTAVAHQSQTPDPTTSADPIYTYNSFHAYFLPSPPGSTTTKLKRDAFDRRAHVVFLRMYSIMK